MHILTQLRTDISKYAYNLTEMKAYCAPSQQHFNLWTTGQNDLPTMPTFSDVSAQNTRILNGYTASYVWGCDVWKATYLQDPQVSMELQAPSLSLAAPGASMCYGSPALGDAPVWMLCCLCQLEPRPLCCSLPEPATSRLSPEICSVVMVWLLILGGETCVPMTRAY